MRFVIENISTNPDNHIYPHQGTNQYHYRGGGGGYIRTPPNCHFPQYFTHKFPLSTIFLPHNFHDCLPPNFHILKAKSDKIYLYCPDIDLYRSFLQCQLTGFQNGQNWMVV